MKLKSNQYSLALYKTGWFYLILIVWCGIYWLVSYFGLNQVNITQQNILNQIFNMLGIETLFSVNAPKRLTQTYLLIYLPLLFNLIGLILIAKSIKFSRILQGIFLTSYLLLLLVINAYFYTQNQWVDVLPSLSVLLCTWLLMLFYQNENQALQQAFNKHNQLLVEAISAFYQNQQYDKITYYLNQAQPNQNLIDHLYKLLKLTENKNKSLAKFLKNWIQLSGFEQTALGKTVATKILVESNQNRQNTLIKTNKSNQTDPVSVNSVPADLIAVKPIEINLNNSPQEALDKTMVIQPGEKNTTQPNQPLYSVKNFGRYAVEGLLGKGAMGIVYQGVDPKINRHVAIKTLLLNHDPEDLEFESRKKQFFKEAETAGNLNHPNIVTIYDVGEEGDLGYIAMDLLTGAPLSEFIKPETRLPIPLIYQLVIQITEALAYAHQNNVVHRDIKPSNIIYDDELQKVTVTDFGIAFVTDQSKTHPNAIVGSPYYMSPEQIAGNKVDGRSDIFSLGVTFYQLLTGYLPFEGESLASVTHQIINAKQSAVSDWDPQLPPSASRITNKAMQKDADKRYQTMQEFQFALVNAFKRDFKNK